MNLLDHHGRSLHRLLGRLTLCEHAASDLIQDLFIRLNKSESFEKAINPYAFAWRTATNLAIDWRRKQKPLVELEKADDISMPSEDVLIMMLQDEQVQCVLDMVARLDELSRNVIIMRYIEQESYEQIALRTGKQSHHLRAVCSRALAKLRNMLGQTDIQQKGAC